MKTLSQILFWLITAQAVFAQTNHNLSMGTSYGNGQYYNLATDVTTSVAHTSWDLAFSIYGMTDGGIFINEGASFSNTAPKVYLVPNKVFSDNLVAGDLGDELKNDEVSWANGALNSTRIQSSSLDYGWGNYNFSNHKIEGTTLFAIELSNGTFKKMMIDTLTSGTYYFRYADFDGTNLQTKSIAKSAYPNQTLAYFSFASNSTVTVEPTTGWDWLFTRYETVIDNAGTPTPYVVGGILTNRGVEAVIADGINPQTVEETNYTTSADSLTIIGHTWKDYGFSSGWTTDADRVCFIKAADSSLYKIQFIDFQGSSTGQGTFIKTSLGKWTSIKKTNTSTALEQFDVYPNPASDLINIAYSLDGAQENLQLQVIDLLGRVLLQKSIAGNEGLNAIELNVNSFETGNYILSLQSERVFISKKIQIK